MDVLATYETYTNTNNFSSNSGSSAPTRYAVRQVLDQEYQKEIIRRENQVRQARYLAGGGGGGGGDSDGSYLIVADDKENPTFKGNGGRKREAGGMTMTTKPNPKKRDFFGRLIVNEDERLPQTTTTTTTTAADGDGDGDDDDDDCGAAAGKNEKRRRTDKQGRGRKGEEDEEMSKKVWIRYHEGVSNAVRRPITLEELMRDL